jgi:hypothetical protein
MNIDKFDTGVPASPKRALACAALTLSVFLGLAGGEAVAQAKVERDVTGRIIALSNLSPSPDCQSMRGSGRITERHLEDGVVRGIDFEDKKDGRLFINAPALYNFKPPSARAAVIEGYEALLQKDQDLTIGFKVCGASGRVAKLDSVALAQSNAAGMAASAPRATATGETKWTYGRHPVLGLSAHIQVGSEAVGLACAYHGSNIAYSDTVSLRITPGLLPRATEPDGAIIAFEGNDSVGGAGSLKSKPAGYLERPEDSCGIPAFQNAKALLLVKGEFVDSEARGKQNVLIIRRDGKSMEFASNTELAKLPETIRVPLEGSKAAIARLMRACPAITRNSSWDCPL